MAGTDSRRIRINKRIRRERQRRDVLLPIDPRDPEVVEAKRTKGRSER